MDLVGAYLESLYLADAGFGASRTNVLTGSSTSCNQHQHHKLSPYALTIWSSGPFLVSRVFLPGTIRKPDGAIPGQALGLRYGSISITFRTAFLRTLSLVLRLRAWIG